MVTDVQSRVKVEIFGHTYTINGDVPPEHILNIARFVNEKMDEISENNPGYSTTQVAILAALNIADEYHQFKALNTGFDTMLQEKTMTLISMLDEGLIGELLGR